jgi:hypothetical protein
MSVQLTDRRRGYRRQASAMAILRPLDPASGPLDAHVFELSMHGAGMSVGQAIEIGTVLGFEMCDGRQSGARIEIRSCRLRADNMFDVGGQFC